MTLYAGTEADYGNAAVKSLANDMETALLALFPEAVLADVRQRQKLILTIAQGVINHINQHVATQLGAITFTAADKVVIEAPAIELGAGATEPGVFGTALTTYLTSLVNTFNAHVHGLGGNTPTVAATMPAGILSSKVTLE